MQSRLKILLPLVLAAILLACSPQTSAPGGAPASRVTLTLGAYTTPREALGAIIPLFQKYWRDKTGQEVEFDESYLGSGAQSRSIIQGFEADVAVLALEADMTRIQREGLIAPDWKSKGAHGMVSNSIVVLAVRKGNPKNIRDWKDLTKPGVDILTPDPMTSGGARWNVMALWGAARRGSVEGYTKGDDASARQFLKDVFKNVSVLDKGARESITNFEKGVGDVAITYENEVKVGQQAGQDYEYVVPHSTILIENPAAVIDVYVDKHGTRAVAEAFRDFLVTPAAQQVFAKYGLRPVDPQVAAASAGQFAAVPDLFRIDDLGGWAAVTPRFFGEDGIYTKLIQEVQTEKAQ